MFQNILVPLDGSHLSEAALSPAAFFARKLGARVVLLHVIEQDAPAEVHKEHHLADPAEAEIYLKAVARQAFPAEIKVETHVHAAPVADVARSIVEHATEEFKPDLIIISTHGKGGMRDALTGSIAQHVVANAKTPVLLIKPGLPAFKLDTILLPLDPDSGHDESLPMAESLATAFHSRIQLLSVIPTYSTVTGKQVATRSLMPSSTVEFLNLRKEAALEHLQEHKKLLEEKGISVSSKLARGEPASVIVKIAQKSGIDLVLLSTHRKAGMAAFWALSVAPKVVQKNKVPALLIPLP